MEAGGNAGELWIHFSQNPHCMTVLGTFGTNIDWMCCLSVRQM